MGLWVTEGKVKVFTIEIIREEKPADTGSDTTEFAVVVDDEKQSIGYCAQLKNMDSRYVKRTKTFSKRAKG